MFTTRDMHTTATRSQHLKIKFFLCDLYRPVIDIVKSYTLTAPTVSLF
jgi:hypothetical protein